MIDAVNPTCDDADVFRGLAAAFGDEQVLTLPAWVEEGDFGGADRYFVFRSLSIGSISVHGKWRMANDHAGANGCDSLWPRESLCTERVGLLVAEVCPSWNRGLDG